MKKKTSLYGLVSVLFLLAFAGCEKKAGSEVVQAPNVAELIGQLDNTDSAQVATAIDKIALLGPRAEAAIPALLRKATDRNFSVNYGAKKALVAIGGKAAKAIVQSNDKGIISDYPLLLGDFGSSAVPLIMDEMQKSRNSDKVMSLLMTLAMMGEPAKAALPLIRKMKANAKGNQGMETLLSVFETQIEEGREGMEKIKKRNDEAISKSKAEVEDINKEFRDDVDKSIGFNITLNPPGARELMNGCNNNLDKGLPEIEKLVASTAVQDKIVACAVLLKFCTSDAKNIKKALPLAKKMCSDSEEIVCMIASVIANKFGDKTDYSERYIKSIRDFKDPTEMMFALGGLIESKARIADKEILDSLKIMLTAKNKDMAMCAAIVLLNSGVTEEVQEFAETLLLEPKPEARMNGAAIIVKIGPAAQSSISKMRRACESETNENAKSFIKMAISSLGEYKDDLLGLVEQTKSQDRFMRLDAFHKMEKLSPEKKKESIPYLLKYIQDGDEDIRAIALSTLCSYGKDAESAFDALVKIMKYALAKENSEMQFSVAHVFGEIGRAEAAPLLLEVIKDGSDAAATAAVVAFRGLGSKGKGIVSDLLELAKDQKYREQLFHVLDSINVLETEDQAKAVASFLGEKNGSTGFIAMKVLTSQGPEICVPLFKEAMLSGEPQARMHGLLGICDIGKNDLAIAVKALEEVKEKSADQKEKAAIDRYIQELKNPIKK